MVRGLVDPMADAFVHLVYKIELRRVLGRLEVFDVRVLVDAEEKRLSVKGG